MLLIRFILITVGLTYLLTQSSLFMLLRVWLNEKSQLLGSLVYCPACSGYWIGFTLWFVGLYPLPTILGPVDAGVAACGLMATWTLAFVRTSSWELEVASTKPSHWLDVTDVHTGVASEKTQQDAAPKE